MYGSLTELRQLLPQVPQTPEVDALLTAYLTRAAGVVDLELGFAFAEYGAAAARDLRRARVGDTLDLPAYEPGSVSGVALVSGKGTSWEMTTTVSDWTPLDDFGALGGPLYRGAGWPDGWYRITAKWGAGPAPAEIVQVALELAVNFWRGRDRGMYSDVIGVEGGGAVGYARALTNLQRDVLAATRRAYRQFGIA